MDFITNLTTESPLHGTLESLRDHPADDIRLEFGLALTRAALLDDSESLILLACLHAQWRDHIPSDRVLAELLDLTTRRAQGAAALEGSRRKAGGAPARKRSRAGGDGPWPPPP